MAFITTQQNEINVLRSQLYGEVILPEDVQYDAARQGFNLTMNQNPSVIVVAKTVEDVVHTVEYAHRMGLSMGVMSTGHGVVLPADNAILIVTSQLTGIEIDADEQTAIIGAGLRWGAVLEAAQAYGLAPLLGSSPLVGVVGYTLGGGMGWLARKYGLATDSVIYFDVITPAGEVVRASADENTDLFWALRGGGGNFGIVLAMKMRLYPVSQVYGGNLFYPVDMAREVFAHYNEWVKTAPDELTTSIVVMNFPPIPALPDFLRGQSYIMVRGCYTGDIEQGEKLLDHWRSWQAPVIDDFKAMPFSDVATISNDPVDPMPALSTGAWLHEISDDVIATLCERVPGSQNIVFAEIRHAGGAIKRVDSQAAAYSNRDADHILLMIGVTPTPEAQAAFVAYTDEIKDAMASALTGGVYLNFVDGEAARQQTRNGYAKGNYEKLVALKSKMDKHNLLRYSFNFSES